MGQEYWESRGLAALGQHVQSHTCKQPQLGVVLRFGHELAAAVPLSFLAGRAERPWYCGTNRASHGRHDRPPPFPFIPVGLPAARR